MIQTYCFCKWQQKHKPILVFSLRVHRQKLVGTHWSSVKMGGRKQPFRTWWVKDISGTGDNTNVTVNMDPKCVGSYGTPNYNKTWSRSTTQVHILKSRLRPNVTVRFITENNPLNSLSQLYLVSRCLFLLIRDSSFCSWILVSSNWQTDQSKTWTNCWT